MTLAEFIQPITQAAYLAAFMAAHLANGVPITSWTSARNPGLSLTQILALYLTGLRALLIQSVSGLFLDYATGTPLTLFAKSQFQLERTPAQFTVGQMVLTSVATAPAYTFAPSDITVGTPGPQTEASRFYTNLEGGTLQPGRLTIVGGGQGLTIARKVSSVTISMVVGAPSSGLSIGVSSTSIAVSLPADAAGRPTLNCADLATALNANIGASALMTATAAGTGSFVVGAVALASLDQGTLILSFTATSPGVGWNIPPNSPLDMKTSYAGVSVANPTWLAGTWVTSQGAEEESDERLKVRCPARWGTIGVAGNEDAFRFWALAIPNGYNSSPVAQATIQAGYLNGTYAAGATVTVIGPSGALGAGDVAAVQANFEAPVASVASTGIPGLAELGRKYPIGTLVSVQSAANHVITLTGTVEILRKANVSVANAQAAVTAALAAYQATLTMGQTIYPQKKVAGVIGQAAPIATAIRDVDLSGMAASITSGYIQYPLLDPSGLTYVLVD